MEVIGEAHSVSEVSARISGSGDDRIEIRETARLIGDCARGVLATNIALRNRAQAAICNTLVASAPYARGHVDCKEIVQDQAVAKAVPIVEVNHPKAHVTHEAAIGSVDSKQLETLMSRGLDEDQAVDLIIQDCSARHVADWRPRPAEGASCRSHRDPFGTVSLFRTLFATINAFVQSPIYYIGGLQSRMCAPISPSCCCAP